MKIALAATAASALLAGGGVHYATVGQVRQLQHRVAALEDHDHWQDVQQSEAGHIDMVMQNYEGYLAHMIECVRQHFNNAIGFPTPDDGSCAFVDGWTNPVKP